MKNLFKHSSENTKFLYQLGAEVQRQSEASLPTVVQTLIEEIEPSGETQNISVNFITTLRKMGFASVNAQNYGDYHRALKVLATKEGISVGRRGFPGNPSTVFPEQVIPKYDLGTIEELDRAISDPEAYTLESLRGDRQILGAQVEAGTETSSLGRPSGRPLNNFALAEASSDIFQSDQIRVVSNDAYGDNTFAFVFSNPEDTNARWDGYVIEAHPIAYDKDTQTHYFTLDPSGHDPTEAAPVFTLKGNVITTPWGQYTVQSIQENGYQANFSRQNPESPVNPFDIQKLAEAVQTPARYSILESEDTIALEWSGKSIWIEKTSAGQFRVTYGVMGRARPLDEQSRRYYEENNPEYNPERVRSAGESHRDFRVTVLPEILNHGFGFERTKAFQLEDRATGTTVKGRAQGTFPSAVTEQMFEFLSR